MILQEAQRRQLRQIFALAMVAVWLAPLPALAACPHAGELAGPVVQTIAGSGNAGINNGSALSASFTEPDGVAVAPNGAIYVADGGAQQIREIRAGKVTTVAGFAPAGASSQQRLGGYLNGSARSARFNRPYALAVGKSGTLYVADELNGAIRQISNGIVTTLSKDFIQPRAIAVDDAGVIYVGDWAGEQGLSEILPDGTVEVVEKTHNVCGVSVKGSGKNRILAYRDFEGIHLLVGKTLKTLGFDHAVEPDFENHVLGFACEILVLDRDSVIVSDAETNSVKFVRFRMDGDVASEAMLRTLAGGYRPGSLAVGGYRDGPPAVSLVDLPRGLALDRGGAILFADAGSRRIRRIVGVDPRGPVSTDENNVLLPAFLPNLHAYKIVMISNSMAFVNSMWQDSIAGQVERGLLAGKSALGLPQCPAVVQYRISGGTITALSNFLTEYYGDGEADLVIFLLDNGMRTLEVRYLQTATGRTAVDWKSSVSAVLRRLDVRLKAKGTKLLLVAVPDGRSASPLEQQGNASLEPYLLNFYSDFKPGYLTYKMAAEYADVIAASGARTLRLLEPMMKFEESAARYPLTNPQDYHPSPQGNIWIGRQIFEYLRSWLPWRKP